MTRLKSSQLSGMNANLTFYDKEFQRKTGISLSQVAARAAGTSDDDLSHVCQSELAAVIPITSGKGVIEGFSRAVNGIIEHMGCPCFVTSETDVAGLAQSIEKGASIVFLADDRRFVAIKLAEGRVVDNTEATAWGYAHALDAMIGGMQDREVLLIGAGKVGNNAVRALDHLGATVGIFDINTNKADAVAAKFKAKREFDLSDALARYTFFFDASPAPAFILPEHIKPDTAVAACGIPLGLSEEARLRIEERLIHDPLQLGVVTMLSMVVLPEKRLKMGGRSE